MDTEPLREKIRETYLGLHNDNYPDDPYAPLFYPGILAIRRAYAFLHYIDRTAPELPDYCDFRMDDDGYEIVWEEKNNKYYIMLDNEPNDVSGTILGENGVLRMNWLTGDSRWIFTPRTELEKQLDGLVKGFEQAKSNLKLMGDEWNPGFEQAYELALELDRG